MAECDTPYFFKGHNFDLQQFRRDLYRLLCYFKASEPIGLLIASNSDGLAGDERQYGIEQLQQEFFTDEVSRILLQTAICVRILSDELEAEPEERSLGICGVYEEPLGRKKDMYLRVACNKLIHADRVNYDQELVPWSAANPMKGISFARPTVYLYGMNRNVSWRAALNVVDFIRHCYSVLRFRNLAEYLKHESSESRG